MIVKHRSHIIFAVSLILLASVSIIIGLRFSEPRVSAAPAWQSKISDWVIANTADGKEAEFLVIMAEQAKLSLAETKSSKQEKGRFVRDSLLAKAQTAQAPIIDLLKSTNKTYR
ncbi:MAG: hypothetical protein AAB401_07565, partial [Acidobacteriota bacterium]